MAIDLSYILEDILNITEYINCNIKDFWGL